MKSEIEKYCIIPIRSGSKGLKDKNMLFFNGKPLVYWTYLSVLNSKMVKKENIFVSTDSNDLKENLNAYGVNVILRDENLALDTTPTSEVMIDFLENKIKEVINS